MNWDTDNEQSDDNNTFGNQDIETFSPARWWCCLLLFLGVVAAVVAVVVGYVLFS